MADPRGFLSVEREIAVRRPVEERLADWKEVYPVTPGHAVLPIISKQASRCMDCGTPFCHLGCPLGNLIPEWNDLVYRDDWRGATERLLATNNFPEITGRLCPALCEASCVEGSNREPVTIKNIEVAIADRAWADRRIEPLTPGWQSTNTVAVVGSGPAGLAAAQQLTRAGHTVVVFERADKPGGLLRYGIPEFKMEKAVLDRRIKQMSLEGTIFRNNTEIGVDVTGEQLIESFDAVVLAIGSTIPRDLNVPGRKFSGIHQAMDYLPQANRVALGKTVDQQITAKGLDVVIIGGGDTGADCLGTALRQGARSVLQLEIMPKPPLTRPDNQPWPIFPNIYRESSAHEEGGERLYSVSTTEFLGDAANHVSGLRVVEVEFKAGKLEALAGTERLIPAQLVLLAMGFTGPQRTGLVEELGLKLDERGNIARDENFATNVPNVFACGDAGRGQSLIVWAIAEGRSAANGVDLLFHGASRLPKPILPNTRPLQA